MGVTSAGTDPAAGGGFGDTPPEADAWGGRYLFVIWQRGLTAHHGAEGGLFVAGGVGPLEPPGTWGPLTFSALAAVGVGTVHALGTVLAGGAGAFVDVKLAQVPVEAWNGGRSHVPAQRLDPPASPRRRADPTGPAGFPWGWLLGALNAGLRPAIESILFTSLEEQSL